MSSEVEKKAEIVVTSNEVLIDKESAQQLTNDIKSTSTALYVLLKRAHDTKAYLAMGYKTWRDRKSTRLNSSH